MSEQNKAAVRRQSVRKEKAAFAEEMQAGLMALMDQLNTNYPRLAQPAPLRNVYISPTGSDSTGAGTLASPWKSMLFGLNKANSLGPGTRVNCGPGNYTESFTPTNINGNATNPIEMVASNGPGTAVNLWGMDCGNLNYLRIQGIKFRGNSDGTNPYAQKFSNGNGSELIAIDSNRVGANPHSSHLEFYLCDLSYSARSGFLCGECTHGQVLSCNIHHNCVTATGAPATGGAGPGLDHGIYNSGNGDHMLFMNNLIHNNKNGYGISNYPGSASPAIISNTIAKNGKGGVSISSGTYDNVTFYNTTNAKVYNNIIGPQVARGTYSFSGGYGIITYRGGNADPTGTADYNIVFGDSSFNNATSAPFVWGANNFQVDPLFNDLANDDFRLKAGSPGLASAFADWSPNYDYTGAVRT